MPTLLYNRQVLLSDLVKANLMPDKVKECRYSYILLELQQIQNTLQGFLPNMELST